MEEKLRFTDSKISEDSVKKLEISRFPVENLSKELARKTGYEILNHRLDFFGIYPRCQENS